MQSHENFAHEQDFMKRLSRRAREAVRDGKSTITGGAPGEEPLTEWQAEGVHCRQMPPDEQNILRISIGGGETPVPLNYCVFRGDHGACVDLLRKALRAMEGGAS